MNMDHVEIQSGPLSLYPTVSAAISGILYGVASMLYYLCARSLYAQLQEPERRRQTIFTLIYISLVMGLMSGFLGLSIRVIQLGYIDPLDPTREPLRYGCLFLTTQPTIFACGAFGTAIQLLTIGIQIWRLWVIWSGTRYTVIVVILPLFLLSGYVALFIAVIAWSSRHTISQDSVEAISITIYSLGPAITTVAAAPVAGRILLIRRRYIRLMGTRDTGAYISIVTMLAESYALESLWTLTTIVLLSIDSPSFVFFTQTDPLIKGIAYFLIVYRVSTGRAWSRETERHLTSLKWNHNTGTKTAPITSQPV